MDELKIEKKEKIKRSYLRWLIDEGDFVGDQDRWFI